MEKILSMGSKLEVFVVVQFKEFKETWLIGKRVREEWQLMCRSLT